MIEYVVGGIIAVGGTVFAIFNARMSAIDDERREREEREEIAHRLGREAPERAAA